MRWQPSRRTRLDIAAPPQRSRQWLEQDLERTARDVFRIHVSTLAIDVDVPRLGLNGVAMTIETGLVVRIGNHMRSPRASLTLLGSATNETNSELVRELRLRGLETTLVPAWEALRLFWGGGVPLLAAPLLERRGVRILNCAQALLATHDKLRTVRLLRAAGLPQPVTAHVRSSDERPPIEPPLV